MATGLFYLKRGIFTGNAPVSRTGRGPTRHKDVNGFAGWVVAASNKTRLPPGRFRWLRHAAEMSDGGQWLHCLKAGMVDC